MGADAWIAGGVEVAKLGVGMWNDAQASRATAHARRRQRQYLAQRRDALENDPIGAEVRALYEEIFDRERYDKMYGQQRGQMGRGQQQRLQSLQSAFASRGMGGSMPASFASAQMQNEFSRNSAALQTQIDQMRMQQGMHAAGQSASLMHYLNPEADYLGRLANLEPPIYQAPNIEVAFGQGAQQGAAYGAATAPAQQTVAAAPPGAQGSGGYELFPDLTGGRQSDTYNYWGQFA